MTKRDFSELPLKDVSLALAHFEKKDVVDEEKVRLTRDLLHKVFGAFLSPKLLKISDKDFEWILRKHLSTRERLPFYEEVYGRLLRDFKGDVTVVDLGAGVNGFSYSYLSKLNSKVRYIAVESVGQLVNLMNSFFKKGKIRGEAVHLSLFELEKLKKLLGKQKKPRVVFLFKVIDSLEMMEKNYSKKLISEISQFSERIVLSFATESMIKRKVFRADRKWLVDFIRENFVVLDEFKSGGEKFIVFRKV